MNTEELKRAEQEAKAARDYAGAIILTTRSPVVVLRADLRVKSANEAFYKTFQTTPDQTEGRLIYEVGNRQWDIPQLRMLLEEIIPKNDFFDDFEVKHNFPHLGQRTILVNARQLDQEADRPPGILLSMEDVTERQRLAEQARVSEMRYRRLFEASHDGLMLLDPVSRKITDANPFMTELLGYTREELLDKELWQIGLLKEEQSSHAAFRQLQLTGVVRYEDLPLQTKSGAKREVEVVANSYEEDGRPVIQCNIRDISERKRMDQELAEKARLLDLSNDAIMVRDRDNRISLWNKGAEKLYGWKCEEVMGKDLHSLMQTEFPKPMEEIVAQLHREGQFRGEVLQIARDGRRIASLCRWVLDSTTQSILTSYTDITARKQTEDAHSRLAAIVESSEDGIISKDLNGVITTWNRGAERIFGYTEQEAIGHPVTMLIPPGRLDEEPYILERIRRGESIDHYETVRRKKVGTLIDISLTISPIRNPVGKIVGASKIARDISHRKRNEAMLHQAQLELADRATQLEHIVSQRTAELRATNQQLEAFVYSVAHDLRAPLRAMEGFSAMLIEEAAGALNATAKDYTKRISNSARFMDALLRDLLAFSQSAQQQSELAAVNLETVVQAVLSRLEKEIKEKKVQVEMLAPWPEVLAHEPTVGQVLFNLVSNALKFVVPDKSPHVRLRAEEKGQFVRVWVEDNGIGIAPHHQEQIFRLFNRLHGERYPGTGVGLAIVQKGIERMGGQVGVESEAGRGSRFWFELRKANQ